MVKLGSANLWIGEHGANGVEVNLVYTTPFKFGVGFLRDSQKLVRVDIILWSYCQNGGRIFVRLLIVSSDVVTPR